VPTWAWVLIAIGAVIAVGLLVAAMLAKRRSGQLRERFGPEYDRTLESSENRRKAEAELAAREARRGEFDIRPLSPAARTRYLETWQVIQAQFVDDPRGAAGSADGLIQTVMMERGYPVEDFDQRAADLSVDHPDVVESYREGHRLAQPEQIDASSTEDLRQAMRHYRTLFDHLAGADEPGPPDREPVETGRRRS
jgi:hypothetical protein